MELSAPPVSSTALPLLEPLLALPPLVLLLAFPLLAGRALLLRSLPFRLFLLEEEEGAGSSGSLHPDAAPAEALCVCVRVSCVRI